MAYTHSLHPLAFLGAGDQGGSESAGAGTSIFLTRRKELRRKGVFPRPDLEEQCLGQNEPRPGLGMFGQPLAGTVRKPPQPGGLSQEASQSV